MLTLTARSYAELIHLPAYEWLRILAEHKYPKQGAAIFKIPYYKPALRNIERYYRQGNNAALLPSNPNQLISITNAAKRDNNFRVIKGFRSSSQSNRSFQLSKPITYQTQIGPVMLRATPDLVGTESGNDKYLLYNCKAVDPNNDLIRTTVEIFHTVLSRNGVSTPLNAVEFICPCTNQAFRWNGKVRQTTLNRAKQIASAIQTVWNSI